MALRVLYALGGIVTAYGAAHGLLVTNLMLDIGLLLLAVAIAAGLRTEHSLHAAWPALLLIAVLFAAIDVPLLRLPSCDSGAVPCLANPMSRPTAVLALFGLFGAVGWAANDLRHFGPPGRAAGGPRGGSAARETS